MKSKLTIAICAILTFSLVLSGCTVAAAPAANEGGNPAGNGYASNPAIYEGGVSARNGYANNAADALETGSGYRGGNGSAGAGTADNCDPVNGGSAAAYPDYAPDKVDLALSLSGYGSDGALGDEQLTLADMLTYAVQDEYLARAEYDRILSENGTIRPFSNILRAEETHIDALLPLFDAYGISAPADEGESRAAGVANLTEAYQAGVNAEVNNIAMYETFLDQNLPSDVRTVFESLMHASENHLRAFQNQL